MAKQTGAPQKQPPLQKPASFNLDAIKEKIMSAAQAHHSA